MFPETNPIRVEIPCREVRRLISDYVDGGLDEETASRVQRHLEQCRHCKAIHDGVRNVIALLGSEDLFAFGRPADPSFQDPPEPER